MSVALLTLFASLSPSPIANSDADTARPETRKIVSKSQLLKIAKIAEQRGDHATAVAALRALSGDPDVSVRNEARFQLGLIAFARGEETAAATWLRSVVDEQPAAQRARLELAKVLVALGDTAAAQRQLRALQASSLPPEVARLVDRYSLGIRATQRQGASIEIALAPDSNITRSTHSDTLGTVLGDFEIGKASQARSGLGLAVAGQAFRRFDTSSRNVGLSVRGRAAGNFYGQPRYNDVTVDVAAGPEIAIGRNRVSLEAGASQHFFGQKAFMRSARIAASWTRPWDRRTQSKVGGTAARIDNQLNDLQDGRSFSIELALERALSQTSGIAVSLAGERQALKDAGYSTTASRASVGGWRDFGRVTITGGLSIGRLEADERMSLFPHKRHDRYRRATIGAAFRHVSIHGFSPSIRFSFERNDSTIELYSYRRRRTEFAMVRSF
jgi:hypothetical protein